MLAMACVSCTMLEIEPATEVNKKYTVRDLDARK
jgi:hypothetical protein